MRQLTKEEIEVTLNGIKRLTQELIDLDCVLSDARLKVEKTIPYSYRKQMKEYNNIILQVEEEIKIKTQSIEEMEKHLKHGVEEKHKQMKDKRGQDR